MRPTPNISAIRATLSGARRWITSSIAAATSGRSRATSPTTSSNDSFLKQVKFGARYADREQNIKYTTYNWGSLSEVWAGNGRLHGSGRRTGRQCLAAQTGTISSAATPTLRRPPTIYNGDLISGYDQAVAFFQAIQAFAARTVRSVAQPRNLGPAGASGRALFQARRSCRAKSRRSGRRRTTPMRCFASARTSRSSATFGSTATSVSGTFTTTCRRRQRRRSALPSSQQALADHGPDIP